MNTRKLLFIIGSMIVIVLISACYNHKSEKAYNKYIESLDLFNISKQVFPDSIIRFHPQRLDTNALKQVIASSNAYKLDDTSYQRLFSVTEFVALYATSSITIRDSIIDWYRSIATSAIQCEANKCFVMTHRNDLLESERNKKLLSQYSTNLSTLCVIPLLGENLFSDEFNVLDKKNEWGIPESYINLTIHSGNAFILPNNYRTEEPFLPQDIRHGYRCGILYRENDKHFIHYTLAW
jgi:hypothetical protein